MNSKEPRSLARRLLTFWLLRLVIVAAAFAAALILREILVTLARSAMNLGEAPTIWLGKRGSPEPTLLVTLYAVAAALTTILCFWGAFWLYARFIEQRSLTEFARAHVARELGLGLGAGVILVLSPIIGLWLFGYFSVIGSGSLVAFVISGSAAATAAFVEELALRGAAFRIIEERFGSWLAIVATSSVFGLAHFGNPDASWLSTISIGAAGGVGLGLAYMLTRRLWFVIAMHAGVNLIPGAVFGLDVSGLSKTGLFSSELHGPEWLTGGEFGLEASLPLLVAGLVAVTVFLVLVLRKPGAVRPFKSLGS